MEISMSHDTIQPMDVTSRIVAVGETSRFRDSSPFFSGAGAYRVK
jgi:hypothetical protein